MATTTLVCAFASNFSLLVTMRVIAGMLAGGLFPVGVAMVGDLVPVEQRQVAIGRLLAVALTGNLIGAIISGVIGDLLGWRGVFFSIGAFGLAVAVDRVLRAFAACAPPSRNRSISLPSPPASAASLPIRARKFASARCFSKASFIHGLFPYVALLLLAAGQTRRSYRRPRDRRVRARRHRLFARLADAARRASASGN